VSVQVCVILRVYHIPRSTTGGCKFLVWENRADGQAKYEPTSQNHWRSGK
jgi:hypothetical protein